MCFLLSNESGELNDNFECWMNWARSVISWYVQTGVTEAVGCKNIEPDLVTKRNDTTKLMVPPGLFSVRA